MAACKKKEQNVENNTGNSTETGQVATKQNGAGTISEIKNKLKMKKEFSAEEINEEYGFEVKKLFTEYVCLSNSSGDDYEEVFIGKIKEGTQLEEIQNHLAIRIETIRLNVKDDEVRSKLEQLSSVVNEEVQGYAIMIVSENAQEIRNEIESLL